MFISPSEREAQFRVYLQTPGSRFIAFYDSQGLAVYVAILTKLAEEYKLLSSSCLSFLQPPATFILLDPNSLVSTLFSFTLLLVSPSERETKMDTCITQVNLSCYKV